MSTAYRSQARQVCQPSLPLVFQNSVTSESVIITLESPSPVEWPPQSKRHGKLLMDRREVVIVSPVHSIGQTSFHRIFFSPPCIFNPPARNDQPLHSVSTPDMPHLVLKPCTILLHCHSACISGVGRIIHMISYPIESQCGCNKVRGTCRKKIQLAACIFFVTGYVTRTTNILPN